VRRNSKETRKRILKAVGRLLARSGFRGVGINSIAQEARVDKVLIYRYFGGLSKLLEAYAKEGDFWPSKEELLAAARESGAQNDVERAAALLIAFGRALRRRPITQEIMRWELLEKNALTEALAEYREKESHELLSAFAGMKGVDVAAIAALLAAGQTYLILRSKTADVYNGIQLGNDGDWSRVEHALTLLLNLIGKQHSAAPVTTSVEPAP
jgi:AcrR family transcriptional regulator